MVMKGIALGIGTSMFASVAIGLGVDFAIHTIDRLKKLYAKFSGDLEKALEDGTILISIIHGNNEIGVIQPLAEVVA